MSTVYNSTVPMTIEKAIAMTGWRIDRSPGRNGIVLTDGENYVHVGEFKWEGRRYFYCERFGANDVEEFVNILGLISEYDVDFYKKNQ